MTGTVPALVTQWIAQTQNARAQAEADLRQATPADNRPSSRDEIAELVRAHSDLIAVLEHAEGAEGAERAELYKKLRLVLTYDSGKQKVLVETVLNQHFNGARTLPVGVRGGT